MRLERSLDQGRILQPLADLLHSEGLRSGCTEHCRGMNTVRKGGTRFPTWSWQGQDKTSAGWERRRNLQDREGAQGAAQLSPENECYSFSSWEAGTRAIRNGDPGFALPCQALTLQLLDIGRSWRESKGPECLWGWGVIRVPREELFIPRGKKYFCILTTNIAVSLHLTEWKTRPSQFSEGAVYSQGSGTGSGSYSEPCWL